MSENWVDITDLKIKISAFLSDGGESVIWMKNCRYIAGKSEKLPNKIEDIIKDLGLNYKKSGEKS